MNLGTRAIVFAFMFVVTAANGSEQIATLTHTDGPVTVFSYPGKKIAGPPPHALFQGVLYSVREAKVGDRVEQGNILRTAPGARARVVYDNGDQFNIGSGTAYRIQWERDAKGVRVNMELMHGRVRGMVEKGGPRGRFFIRTRAATMGVRGTDFLVTTGGVDDGTEIAILRGAVDVSPLGSASGSRVKPLTVKSGQSVEVLLAPVMANVTVRQTTREELIAIGQASRLFPSAGAQAIEIAQRVEQLDKEAVQAVLRDIRAEDPVFHAQVEQKVAAMSSRSAADLDAIVIGQLAEAAPIGGEKRKPSRVELENLERRAYEKYFRLDK